MIFIDAELYPTNGQLSSSEWTNVVATPFIKVYRMLFKPFLGNLGPMTCVQMFTKQCKVAVTEQRRLGRPMDPAHTT